MSIEIPGGIGEACDFAGHIARQAGEEILMREYGKLQELAWDERGVFTTEVDQESDRFLRGAIEQRYPDHGILSEETDTKETPSRWRWVVDPLDGTVNYVTGVGDHFSVVVALCDGPTPVLGVTYAPKRRELYATIRGGGATLNGRLISVSREEEFRKMFVCLEHGKPPGRQRAAKIADRLLVEGGVVAVLILHGAAMCLADVACGRCHAFAAASGLQPWDMAAGVVLCREAGARVTTLEGKEWELGDESIVVAHPRNHEQFLARIS